MTGSAAPIPLSGRGSGLRFEGCLLLLKIFVHKLLRLSRVSGVVVQVALCYLEAVHPKIPHLLQKEQVGIEICRDPDILSRIVPATELELKLKEDCEGLEMANPDEMLTQDDLVSTVRVVDSFVQDVPTAGVIATAGALSSPLLCPRQTFLASLILASKFMQDKSYSNSIWAEISGLPVWEIGCCERALGETLEWWL